ncbi:hypothetical protein ABZ892_08780 [Streptomyces sp. NPDC046924]
MAPPTRPSLHSSATSRRRPRGGARRTRGRGTFTTRPTGYAPAPAAVSVR